MGSKMKKKKRDFLLSLIPVIAFAAMVLCMPFYSIEARLSDYLYSQLQGTSRNIKLITVDEETLDAYGDFTGWSREKCAALINYL